MVTIEEQIEILDKHFQNCLSFWKRNGSCEISAFELALYDLRDTWYNPFSTKSSTLNRDITLEICATYTARLDSMYKQHWDNHKKTFRDDHIRRCTECSKPMKEGYLVGQGAQYYCSDECLHKHYTLQEWNRLCCQNGDEDICNTPDYNWESKEISDENYYTEWESIYTE